MPKSKKQATESAAQSAATGELTDRKQPSKADSYGWEQVQTEAKPKRGRPRKVAEPEQKPAPAPDRESAQVTAKPRGRPRKQAEVQEKPAPSATRQKKAKAEPKATPASEPTEPADLVVFAFRLTQAEREEIHNAAGPAKASRFVRTIVLAAARRDIAAIKTALGQVATS